MALLTGAADLDAPLRDPVPPDKLALRSGAYVRMHACVCMCKCMYVSVCMYVYV